MKNLTRVISTLLLVAHASLLSRDTLLEFKAAAFLPTDRCLKSIYGKVAGIYGLEATVQLCEGNEHWYAFASADFLTKKGYSVGLCTPTKMYLIPLALGAKYMVPFCYGDFYLGLGFQPTYLKTVNCSSTVLQTTSNWGFGGVAKTGAYINLPCNFFLDPFVAYSFATVSSPTCTQTSCIKPVKAKVSGGALGIGIGYKFD